MRHLLAAQAVQALRRGASIAQLLPHPAGADDSDLVTWLRASPGPADTYVLGRHVVLDEGSPDFCDLWEFSPQDPEESLGEGVDLGDFASPEALLEAATADWGAVADRWVNHDVVQDEYRDRRLGH